MKSSELLQIIREAVRKEVRTVLKEELSKFTQPIKEQYNPTIESVKRVSKPKPKPTGNSIQDLLNETAYEGEWRTMGGGTYGSSQAQNFGW